ncbi:NUDIX domain-containing protein [Candidatus Halobonum tyrrellensis]|uniref:NUDIX hydrolase n=1 Tax=Candidatus Halobonum tyrrellensis G22 TaxID=1324957 RepID=V4HBB8_9EURY|nr:NUDIX domain-containing protein [Candidatus Halobonum tyrrellensis]ESP88000.1 NUDIX hydrolase [Candidatus Halobonum tyrrellensis G22]
MSDIRGVALGAVEHPDTGAYLVQRLPGDRDGPHFHRFVGGGIHPGEPSGAALEREFREELGVTVEPGPAVCTVENLFTYEGVPHHEFAVVRVARFADASLYDRERFSGVDTGGVEYEAYWRTLADLRDGEAPFFPEGVADPLAAHDADDAAPGEGVGHVVSPDPATDER